MGSWQIYAVNLFLPHGLWIERQNLDMIFEGGSKQEAGPETLVSMI